MTYEQMEQEVIRIRAELADALLYLNAASEYRTRCRAVVLDLGTWYAAADERKLAEIREALVAFEETILRKVQI